MSQGLKQAPEISKKDQLWKSLFESKLQNELFTLQKEQFDHDIKYHRDIHVLSVHHRLNHMALHFAKYVGRLVESYQPDSVSEDYKKTLIDVFIISLSSANILNLNLAEQIKEVNKNPSSDFFELSRMLGDRDQLTIINPLYTIKALSIYTGRLAKACESVDHLEKYPFRESISDCVIRISMQAIMSASVEGIDLSKEVRSRLASVKKKNIFYPIGN